MDTHSKELTGFALVSGTPCKVITPGPPPPGIEWDDDHQRTSSQLKKRMIENFFRGNKKMKAEIAWITSESVRDQLRRKGFMKVKVRESAGSMITFTAPAANLRKA